MPVGRFQSSERDVVTGVRSPNLDTGTSNYLKENATFMGHGPLPNAKSTLGGDGHAR